METVASYFTTEEAHLLRMRLEQAGIPAFVKDDLSGQLMPYLIHAIGGIRVQVPPEYREEAARVLNEDPAIQPPHQNGKWEEDET